MKNQFKGKFNSEAKIQAISSVRNLASGRVWTLTDIRSEVEKAQAILRQKGYRPCPVATIAFNQRTKKTCGRTFQDESGRISMDFSTTYIENSSPEGIRNTAAHEAIHTIPGCFNHGARFKEAARELRAVGYNVTGHNTDKDYRDFYQKKASERPILYVLCHTCGKRMSERRKMTPALEAILIPGQTRYHCCRCKSTDLHVMKRFPDGTEIEIRDPSRGYYPVSPKRRK